MLNAYILKNPPPLLVPFLTKVSYVTSLQNGIRLFKFDYKTVTFHTKLIFFDKVCFVVKQAIQSYRFESDTQ